jgi:serine/threonine-protein kinase
VGSRWSALLDRALAHAPADRFPDAGAMRDAILAELARLDVTSPERELADWLDDPAAFAASHSKRMVDKLVLLGGEARKQGDAIAAAGDYNRALAHAPDDPQLLRIVGGMHRAEARARILRRAALAVLLMVGLGGVAFGAGRVLRLRGPVPEPTAPTAVATVSATVVPSGSASVTAPTTSASSVRATILKPIGLPATASAKPVSRNVTLDLRPNIMNVTVAVDGAPAGVHSSGESLTLDGRAHSLGFGCPVCNPGSQDVPAGEEDQVVVMKLTIKPATLVIHGDASKTYQLEKRAEVVRAGTNNVAMTSGRDPDTVKQLETGVEVKVTLLAGQSVDATF